MNRRTLGKGLEVSALGFGCMSLSSGPYGTAEPAEAERTLRRTLDLGIDFFDTANVYGQGHNEEFVGRLLGPVRDSVVLATKYGITAGEGGARGVDARPEVVAPRCDESLQRLGFDIIDLYYLHRPDPAVPIEDSVGAMADLVRAGKVRHLGLSEVNAATLRRACAVHPIAALQCEYSLWTRDAERELLPTCRELGVGFVPFSPLGRGMLTGAIRDPERLEERDMRRRFPRFRAEHFEQNRALVDALGRKADALGCSAGQLALAWVMAQGDDVVPIPGTKRVVALEENVGAASLALGSADLSALDALFAPERVSGDRYPSRMLKAVQRDTPLPQ